mgnify:CR=1 FL=1
MTRRTYPAGTALRVVSDDTSEYAIMADCPDGDVMARLLFQDGVIPEVGVNGITNEVLIQVLISRLTRLNDKLPCYENVAALGHLSSAGDWLAERTRRRQAQEVEGTEAPHLSAYRSGLGGALNAVKVERDGS